MKHLRRLLVLFVVMTMLPVTPALAAPGDTTRVSVATGGVQANSFSQSPSITPDGRYVAFASSATNLVPGDTNTLFDIFVHDRATGTTSRVSVASDGTQANNDSILSCISANGNLVAFESSATNLVPGDTNGTADIFVRNRAAGTTTRVSVSSGGAQGTRGSGHPSIAANGNFVAFHSVDTNLVAGDSNGVQDIFVHDLTTGATTRVSVASAGTQANDRSEFPAISADGRYVVFESYASNLVAGDTNGTEDVFVHDRTTGATTRISVASGGAQGNATSTSPAISSDGSYVVFSSVADNLVPSDTNGAQDIFVHDRTTGSTTRVSVSSANGQGNKFSNFGSISPEGRYVTFMSLATNLVPGDTNGQSDVFVHDRTTGLTTRVSVSSSGAQGNNTSIESSISSNGSYVAFSSNATNLIAGDTNRQMDIFVHEAGAIPPPIVIFGAGSVPPRNGAALSTHPSMLTVLFSQNVLGDGSRNAANSLWNWMLVRPGPNGTFDTTVASAAICDSDHVASGDDEKIDLIDVTYNASTFSAAVTIDPFFAPLADGQYRLYVCGAASILGLSGLALNGGANTPIDFTVGAAAGGAMPSTGFAPNRLTALSRQSVLYSDLGNLWLEIPRLGVKMTIVGVPQTNGEWNVSWLGSQAGWLEGSAYPSWKGNSVLTGHVWNADNSAGPFRYLNTLWWGDKVIIHLSGQQYIYEVRSVKEVAPTATGAMLKHEELPWLTLVTCRGYDEVTSSYRARVLVRAVLIDVK